MFNRLVDKKTHILFASIFMLLLISNSVIPIKLFAKSFATVTYQTITPTPFGIPGNNYYTDFPNSMPSIDSKQTSTTSHLNSQSDQLSISTPSVKIKSKSTRTEQPEKSPSSPDSDNNSNSTNNHKSSSTTSSTTSNSNSTSKTTAIKNIKGPVKFAFVNSFWTDNTPPGAVTASASASRLTASSLDPVSKQEVDPGEGNSILAVTIMNAGFSDITSIKGSFDFPTGFKALVTPDNVDSDTALSSYDGIIKAGNTFTLYFPVSILKNTQVDKEYEGTLKIKYFKLTEQNKKKFRTTNIDVPFKLSGKVILSAEGEVSSQIDPNSNQYSNGGQSIPNVINVIAGSQSTLQINIKNKGTATATDVVVRVVNNNQQIMTNDITSAISNSTSSKSASSSTTQLQYLTLGPTTFDIGTISSGEQHQINPIIFPASSSGNVIENLNLQIMYNDANGNKKILEQVIGLQIVPTSPQNDFYISPVTDQYIHGSDNPYPILSNSSKDKEFNSNGVYFTTFKNDITNITNASTISSNHSPIHLNTSSSIKSYSQYSPDSKSNPLQIVAGKIQDLNFRINSFDNTSSLNSNNVISNIAITLIPQSSSVKILGNSVWNLHNINDKSAVLSTQVYASSSLIDTPVFFTANIQYLKNGQLKNTSFNLGAIVVGNIILDINDFSIRSMGNTLNVVGNVLNKGNVPSLFSKISLMPFKSSNSILSSDNTSSDLYGNTSQYIGTIPVNTPVPFNIPLPKSLINSQQDLFSNSKKMNLSSIPASFSFLVSYTDDTQNQHSSIINKHIKMSQRSFINNINNNQSTAITNIANNGFIDSFWTSYAPLQSHTGSTNNTLSQTSIQKEMGPGDGRSVLAIDLTNTEFSDISGVTGYLSLPQGFSAYNSKSNNNLQASDNNGAKIDGVYPSTTVASVNSIIKSGQTYTLYFKVNVLDSAAVGKHIGKLQLYYFRVPDPQTGIYRTQNIDIPFDLPGKVIMDATSNSTNLMPGQMNHVSISINNKGTAVANGITVTILGNDQSIIGSVDTGNVINSNSNSTVTTNSQQTTTSPIIISGSSIYNIGTIPVKNSSKIDIGILPSMLSEQSLQTMDIKIAYTDSVGNSKSVDSIIGFNILPIPPQSGLKISPSTISIPPQSGLKISADINKKSILPVIKEGVYNQASNNNSKVNLISKTQEMTFYPKVSNADILKKTDTVQNLTNKNNDYSNINSNDSLMLVAGKIDNLVFNITNSNNLPISNAVVTLTSDSSSLQIQGNSMWSFDVLDPNITYQLSTPIFASTSLISSPVSFTVTVQYIYKGQFKTTSFKLGGNVIGDISVEIYGVDIKNIAGIPNVVGNLLNKGNTQALFTTVELFSDPDQIQAELKKLSDSGQNTTNIKMVTPSSSTPQYLGDLQQDSPLPFSIPLTLDNKSSSGKYLIPLKVTYDDSLKNNHVIFSSYIVNYKSMHQSSNHDKGFASTMITNITKPVNIILIVIIIIIAYFIISKIKKRSKLKHSKNESNSIEDEDDFNLFDDIKNEDNDKKTSKGEDFK